MKCLYYESVLDFVGHDMSVLAFEYEKIVCIPLDIFKQKLCVKSKFMGCDEYRRAE